MDRAPSRADLIEKVLRSVERRNAPPKLWGDALVVPIRLSRLIVDRLSYFVKRGMENNPKLGIVSTDDNLLRFITNI